MPTFSEHARVELKRRGITTEQVSQVLENPEQVVPAYGGRKAYQSRIEAGGKTYLLRAIVSPGESPTVVTVYRTSRIEKYWRNE